MKIAVLTILALVSLSVHAKKQIHRAPASSDVKTMICVTNDASPNVDIRVEMKKKSAIVKLITFGNDVSDAPTDGPSTEISRVDALGLIGGNAAIAFYDQSLGYAGGRLLALRNHDGFIALPGGSGNQVYPVNDCAVK